MTTQFFRRIDILEKPSDDQIRNILHIETADQLDEWKHHSEQYGLFHLYTPTSPTPGFAQHAHELDVVAIHGLGGDAFRTWQHENGFNWLQHLHKDLPGIRVYSYGYDSGIAFSDGTARLTDYARHLLTLVKLTRSSASEKKRKIVFVCHSMGGLLAKQAILLSSNERGLYGALRESVCAMLFFGTPHSGSASQYYADILCNIADAILFTTPADKLVESFRAALLESLQSSRRILLHLAEKFQSEAYHLKQISSFIEKSNLPGMEDVLVGNISGRLGTSNERVIPMLNHDHRQICKHASLATQGMKMILNELRDVADREIAELTSSMSGLQIVHPRDRFTINTSVEMQRNDALLRVTAAGNLAAVKRLIENGADINTHNQELKTPLHLACQHGHVALTLFLGDKGANVNTSDNQGNNPLHLAASRGDQVLTLRILEWGGDPNAQDKDGCTPLHRAAAAGDEATVKNLLQSDADWTIRNKSNELPVRVARKAHQPGVLKLLHKQGESTQQALMKAIDSRPRGGHLTASEASARFVAYNFPGVEYVHLDMDMDTTQSASNLAKVAERGDLETVEHMLDLGIEPTPDALYLAAKGNHSDVVEVLADVMDDIDAHGGWSGNALCAAACHSQGYNTVRVLLEKGANVNWQGGKYGCPLQAATACYTLEIVKLLLQHGADVNLQCGHYGNALTAAARHRTHFEEMTTLFLEYGADINAQGPGEYGNPLQTAVYLIHAESVKFLLQNGASKTAQGRFGSALDIAQRGAFRHDSDKQAQEDILVMLTEDEFVGFITEE